MRAKLSQEVRKVGQKLWVRCGCLCGAREFKGIMYVKPLGESEVAQWLLPSFSEKKKIKFVI